MCNIIEPYPREIESCELCGIFSYVSFLDTISVCDNCLDLFIHNENLKASHHENDDKEL